MARRASSDSGPAKKLFDLTGKGRECLAKWVATLREYREQIGQLLGHLERATAMPVSGCGCHKERRRKPVPRSAARPRKA